MPTVRTYRPRTPALGILVVLLLVSTTYVALPPAAGNQATPALSSQAEFDLHVHHIVVMMMENHAFDNYFGVYCQKKGPYCPMKVNGLPRGLCVPEYPPNATPCIAPYEEKQTNLTEPLPHNATSSVDSWDNGTNDGFYLAEQSGKVPFGFYDRTRIPLYWDLAEQYGLGDAFFSSNLSYSLPNHWHLVAGQSPPALNSRIRTGKAASTYANHQAYLDQANQTPTIQDELINHSAVTWKYYDYYLGRNYTKSIGNLSSSSSATAPAFNFWDPMAAKAETYNASFAPHFANKTAFFPDAAHGNLPNISFIIPPGNDSDHPPSSTAYAQGWVASVVNAVESSPEWNTTALFITWDEYGGFYDHVSPPLANGTNSRLGFRVPLLVIGPYAKQGYVDPNTGYFESLLHLIENTFHLGCLTVMDCQAPGLYSYFAYSAAGPRPPMLFPTTVSGPNAAVYPMPLQKNNTVRAPLPPYVPPIMYTYFPHGTGPDVD